MITNEADGPSGFLLDESGISVAKLHPAAGEYLVLPGLPLNLIADPKRARLAVIDSGVLSDHPQLRGAVLAQADFTGAGTEDRHGHGTVVSLILLRSSYQAQAKLEPAAIAVAGFLSAKVVQENGRIERKHVIKAIHWVVENGARVVNLSLGFPGTAKENAALGEAIAAHPGVIFTAAAGNLGRDFTVYPAGFDLPNVISVGATDPSGAVAGYSGRGAIYAPGTISLQPYREAPPSEPVR